MKKENYSNYLANVPPEKAFWVNNDGVLNNLDELASALKEMSMEQFQHHVSKEKNDFSNWIRDVIGDVTLANKLRRLKTKSAAVKAVRLRILQLKRRSK
jgi:hypothetical protein